MPVIRRRLAVSTPVRLEAKSVRRPSVISINRPVVEPWGNEETQFLLTVREAAKALATSPYQIRKLFHQRKLTPIRIGNKDKVDRREIIALIEIAKAS